MYDIHKIAGGFKGPSITLPTRPYGSRGQGLALWSPVETGRPIPAATGSGTGFADENHWHKKIALPDLDHWPKLSGITTDITSDQGRS